MSRFAGITLLTLGMTFGYAAANKALISPGTWKLNVEKSQFSPGPGPKSGMFSVGAEGKIDYTAELADGTVVHWSVQPEEGKPVPVSGIEGATLLEKHIDDKTFEHSWKLTNRPANARGVLSDDGKTLTYTFSSSAPDGTAEKNVEIFERQ